MNVLAVAAESFRRFFDELRSVFYERESLLTQIELALLCREHVLAMGPPGTAKSVMATLILNRIVDEKTLAPSVFSKQLSESTVQTDLIGPVDFKVLTETGRTEYLTDDGMLGATHAFLDEVFDGRDMLLRSILNVLHERELKHGRRVTAGRLECALMTSNRYLSEVVARSPELMLAVADRLAFIAFVPKGFARASSRAAMLSWSAQGQRPNLRAVLTLQQLDSLQAAVDQVVVPPLMLEGIEILADELERLIQEQVSKLPDYVPTKYFSQRTVVKAIWALKAAVVRDAIYRRPDRALEVHLEDLAGLRAFFLLGGPDSGDTEALLKTAVDPRERAQLEIVRIEHQVFEQAMEKVRAELGGGVGREATALGFVELNQGAEAQVHGFLPSTAGTLARTLASKLIPGPRHPANRIPLVAAARTLVAATQSRLARAPLRKSENVSIGGTVAAVGEVLELARAVPELLPSLLPLAEAAARFGAEALELCLLSVSALEMDSGGADPGFEPLAEAARSLEQDLSAAHELGLRLDALVPAAVETMRERERQARQEIAASLRERVERLFGASRGRRAQPSLDSLASEARRLGVMEARLTALDPAQKGLRQTLLQPVARLYVLGVCTTVPFQKVEQFARTLQMMAENLRQEGLEPGPILEEARTAIDERLQRFADEVKVNATNTGTADLTVAAVLAGEGYSKYRGKFQGAPEGELVAALSLEAQLSSEKGSRGKIVLSSVVKAALVDAELAALASRVEFLRTYFALLLESFPRGAASPSEADRIFEGFIRTRFPQLALKEGELVRLNGALETLAQAGPERREDAQRLQTATRALSEELATFSRRLLSARVRG